MRGTWIAVVAACSSNPGAPPAAPVATPPPAVPRPVASPVPDAAEVRVVDVTPPPEPLRPIAKLELRPSYGAAVLGASRTRPVMVTVDGDGGIATTRLDTGERVERWKPVELAALASSPWTPGHATKSGKPELAYDLAGKLDAVRAEAKQLRELLLETRAEQSLAAISANGATTIVAGGDLLYWLRDDKPPVLLDPGASYRAAVSPDGKRVAYDGCGSPCGGTYTLRLVDLGETPKPRLTTLTAPATQFWTADGAAVIARTATCVMRVDAASLAVSTVACGKQLEVAPTAGRDGVVVVIQTETGWQLRRYGGDGKLASLGSLATKIAKVVLIDALAVSGGGLAVVTLAGRDNETWLVDRDGHGHVVALPGNGYISSAAWLDDDRLLALVGDTVYLIDVPALLKSM